MKQQEINVTLENYEDVVFELKKKVDQLSVYEEEFSEWTTSELMSYSEDDAPGMMLQALEYIIENKKQMLDLMFMGPVKVRFSAKIDLISLLGYGQDYMQEDYFAITLYNAINALKNTFSASYSEFSEIIFSSDNEGEITLIWETKKPVIYDEVLQYPRSLMELALILEMMGIEGLEFDTLHQEIIPLYCDEDKAVRQNFARGEFVSYDDNNYKIVQHVSGGIVGEIHYSLSNSYELYIGKHSDEESLKALLESGYHLEGESLKKGIIGEVKYVGLLS